MYISHGRCVVLFGVGEDTLLLQCLSLPWCITGYQQPVEAVGQTERTTDEDLQWTGISSNQFDSATVVHVFSNLRFYVQN